MIPKAHGLSCLLNRSQLAEMYLSGANRDMTRNARSQGHVTVGRPADYAGGRTQNSQIRAPQPARLGGEDPAPDRRLRAALASRPVGYAV
jgi:hypothetical protein